MPDVSERRDWHGTELQHVQPVVPPARVTVRFMARPLLRGTAGGVTRRAVGSVAARCLVTPAGRTRARAAPEQRPEQRSRIPGGVTGRRVHL